MIILEHDKLDIMEWISVFDRLPEDFEEYLVWPEPNRDLNIITANFDFTNKRWEQDFKSGYDFEIFYPIVTHWMPLPEPPKE